MLPFLKKDRNLGGLIVKTREPDEAPEADEADSDLHAGAHEMLSAIGAGDHKRLAQAMKDMHTMLSSRDTEDTDYDEQNQEAAKGPF